MSCLFCKIANGEIPAERVAENEHAVAFLDIQPLAKGHVLVIPREHAVRVEDMGADAAAGLMRLAQTVIRRQGDALGATGQTVAINNGRDAGQEVMHVHLHVVPRREGDGFGPVHALFTKRPTLREGELKEIAAQLRS